MGYLLLPIGLILFVIYVIVLTKNKKRKQVLVDIDELNVIKEKIPVILTENALGKISDIVEEIADKYPKNAEVISLVDIIKDDLHQRKISIVNKYQNLNIDDIPTN